MISRLKFFLIYFLLRVGFVAINPRTMRIDWPFRGPPRWVWASWRNPVQLLRLLSALSGSWWPYRFRNRTGVRKWIPGRLLPFRWGFGWLGFEFGDRGH